MQKPSERTERMLLASTEREVFDAVVSKDHSFRKLNEIIDWGTLLSPLADCYSATGMPGIDMEKGAKALLIQFWEDYSDRQEKRKSKAQNRARLSEKQGGRPRCH